MQKVGDVKGQGDTLLSMGGLYAVLGEYVNAEKALVLFFWASFILVGETG